VVTNVQPDHLDHWGDAAGVERGYADFARTIRPGGLLVTNADDPGAARLAERAREEGVRVGTWGTGAGEAPDVLLRHARTEGMTSTATLVWSRALGPVSEGTSAELRLPVPGLHSLHNGTAAVLAATAGLGLPLEPVLEGLAAFPG